MEGSGSADNIAKLETRLAELRGTEEKRQEEGQIQELLERGDAGGDRPEDVNIVLVIEKAIRKLHGEAASVRVGRMGKKERECVLKVQRLHGHLRKNEARHEIRIEDLETVVNKLSKLKLQADLEHASEEQDELRGKLDEALQCERLLQIRV